MNTNIESRKEIIKSLKPTIDWGNKKIENRIKFLQGITVVNLALTILCGGILLFSIITEILDLQYIEWNNIGLLAILSLSFVLNLPFQLYELKLTNHLIKLNTTTNFNGLQKLNEELRTIVTELNDKLKNNWFTFLLALIILILGIWQMGSKSNLIWNYMKIPVILFYCIVFYKFWKNHRSLTKNIIAAENTVANNVYS
jgi:hypothetical protein